MVHLENVPAAQLVPILRPLVPQQGHLVAYPQSNVLIISDTAANVGRLASIIGRIDVSGEAEVEPIPLRHASAQEVVRILTTLLPAQGKGQARGSPVRFVADDRTNSVLVSGDKESRLQVRAIIGHLDTPSEEQGNTHVVYLRYAEAKDLVPILEGVVTGAADDIRPLAKAPSLAKMSWRSRQPIVGPRLSPIDSKRTSTTNTMRKRRRSNSTWRVANWCGHWINHRSSIRWG